jgi:hypothetical protein
MKYLTILLLSFPIYSLDLDLTIPELPYDYVVEPIVEEDYRFLHLGDYQEPPTRGQIIYFWTFNALDVWTTHRGMKQSPYIREANPLLDDRPELEELILQKAVVGGLIHKYGSSDYITAMNVTLTYVVWNNYNIVYND